MKKITTSLALTIMLVSGIAIAQPIEHRKHPIAAALESENAQARQQAAQKIANIGLALPLEHPNRKRAALMLFTAWRVEQDKTTRVRLAHMIIALGFRVQYFTRLETTGGEKPEQVADLQLIGPFAPKPPAAPPANPKSADPPPPDPPEPEPEATPPKETSVPPSKPLDWSNLYPSLNTPQDPHLAARAANARRNPIHHLVPYALRMNGLNDDSVGSIDTDITKSCATSIRCYPTCPVGAKCVPCDASDRKRLAEMREAMRNNPHGFQPQTQGLLNIIPIMIMIIRGDPIEDILQPRL